jgi:hypothetical protein
MISEHINKLLFKIENYKIPNYLSFGKDERFLGAEKITSNAAKYYEKLRVALDYKEEHLLRRSAIERILKRSITFGYSNDKMAKMLVFELMQAGYLPSAELPEVLMERIQSIIEKNLLFMNFVKDVSGNMSKSILFDSKIIGLAACEVEEMLFLPILKEESVNTFYQIVAPYVDVVDFKISDKEKYSQIYLACHRGLLKSDKTQLFYKLWIMRNPDWFDIESKSSLGSERLKVLAGEFNSVRVLLESQLDHPLQSKLISMLRDDSIYFLSIMGVLEKYHKNSRDVFSNPEFLSKEIQDFIERKYEDERYKTKKSSVRAIFYIFITKIILAFLIEIPYDVFIVGSIQYLALGINVAFHPLFLFLMTRNTAVNGPDNTRKIAEGVNNIVYGEKRKDIIIKLKNKKGFLHYSAIFFYSVFFTISFGGIIWLLNFLKFNFVAIVLFLLFFALVSFFGFRIRFIARQWTVRRNDESILSFLWDILTLPIIRMGRWLTNKFSSINIFVFIMDFLIETPFKALLKVFDSFISFLKEKKEEIY